MELAQLDVASEQYLGQWKRLVSTTNWEKGRIICQWRQSLREQGASNSEFSDETWSLRVGHVTPQHVGRLRRVFERFAEQQVSFAGLFWSHFQAALDWDDAEMWLEGATQSTWSVAQMRDTRRQSLGSAAEAEAPDAEEAPWDEDAEPGDSDSGEAAVAVTAEIRPTSAATGGGETDETDEAGFDHSEFDDSDVDTQATASTENLRELVRPFAELPELPPDVNEAFESYKLCILRHKLSGWQELSRDDMLASLEALRQLTLAAAE